MLRFDALLLHDSEDTFVTLYIAVSCYSGQVGTVEQAVSKHVGVRVTVRLLHNIITY